MSSLRPLSQGYSAGPKAPLASMSPKSHCPPSKLEAALYLMRTLAANEILDLLAGTRADVSPFYTLKNVLPLPTRPYG